MTALPFFSGETVADPLRIDGGSVVSGAPIQRSPKRNTPPQARRRRVRCCVRFRPPVGRAGDRLPATQPRRRPVRVAAQTPPIRASDTQAGALLRAVGGTSSRRAYTTVFEAREIMAAEFSDPVDRTTAAGPFIFVFGVGFWGDLI